MTFVKSSIVKLIHCRSDQCLGVRWVSRRRRSSSDNACGRRLSPALSESYRTDAAMRAGRCSMEAKPRQNASDRGRLLVRKLNPDPLPNHFGNFIDAGRIAAEQPVFRRQRELGGSGRRADKDGLASGDRWNRGLRGVPVR
jgi:hypothetical protein